MIRYIRGTKVIISTIFHDTSGDVVYPTTVNISIAYPSASTTSNWPFDGTDLLTTTVTMTTPSTVSTAALVGQCLTTWDSSASAPGVVYWTAVPNDQTWGINEGKFELRGGLANPTAIPST